MRWLDSITNSIDMNSSILQEIVEDRAAWLAVVRGVAWTWGWTGHQQCVGGVFQLFWRRGGDFQALGRCPLFGLYGPGICGCVIEHFDVLQ